MHRDPEVHEVDVFHPLIADDDVSNPTLASYLRHPILAEAIASSSALLLYPTEHAVDIADQMKLR